ncbi:MAG: MMPL family transporter [Acidimicrobiia bacterium]|nr:MMPL family transporter [Acidimicrobiia bacterium]MYB75131.1 MMPL family transporter [Acidimicrobiia bacterium]MYI00253.1 MMPL family transporter [Acidimicrobiia bacterium]
MFRWQARAIQRSPQLVLLVLGALTLALLAGFLVRDRPQGPIDSTGIFLPADSDLAEATDAIRESFPAAADLRVVQILAKGDVLTADSLRTVNGLQTAIISDPEIAPFLVDDPLYGYVQLIELAAADVGLRLETLTDAQVSLGLAELAQDPERAELNDLLGRFVARGGDGAPIAGLSLVILDDVGDALGQEAAQLRAHEIADSFDTASLDVTIITLAKSDAEGKDAREENLLILTVIALAVIVVLLALFYRTQSDVHITMLGLGMTILWTFGALSWLSPGGVGIVDPDNILLTLVPVLLISLSVDYALQIVGRYREALREGNEGGGNADHAEDTGEGGDASGRAIARSVRLCGVPVLLAAGTTAISLLANLSSRFEPIADFGIIASIGVISGWIVMTNFVPSARLMLDRRLAAKGKAPTTRPLADTIPGAGAVLPRVATGVARRPLPVIIVALALTVLSVVAASNLSTSFAVKDFLPNDSDTFQSFDFLEENFDGSATLMTVLIETDLDNARAVRNLTDLHETLVDPLRRPDGIVGPPLASAGTLLADSTGQSGVNYDPAVAAAFDHLNTSITATDEEARQAWNLLRSADPEGFAEVLDLRSGELDRTIIQIPVAVESNEALQELITELETLWGGDTSEITVTGGDALIALITEELADSQVLSVGLVIAAALAILVAYFAISQSRPLLGLITIIPIAVTLSWLLGAMWVFGISYNMGTALMVVLTIGIGVDYTIHLTHRFLEELQESVRVVEAIRGAMVTTGGALLASALTTALGLLALLFSPLVPMQELGILAAVAILFGLIATFTVLPPLLVLWAHYHRWRIHEASLVSAGGG